MGRLGKYISEASKKPHGEFVGGYFSGEYAYYGKGGQEVTFQHHFPQKRKHREKVSAKYLIELENEESVKWWTYSPTATRHRVTRYDYLK